MSGVGFRECLQSAGRMRERVNEDRRRKRAEETKNKGEKRERVTGQGESLTLNLRSVRLL